MLSQDPYFLPAYAKLNELVEGGRADTFMYAGPEGSVTYSFLVRPVEFSSAVTLFDIISPYGYGGPLLSPVCDEAMADLVRAFHSAFRDYCRDNHIVSEFVRFHPFSPGVGFLGSMYKLCRLRATVTTSLVGDRVIEREFSKRTRKKIRHNIRAGIDVTSRESPVRFEDFKRIYSQTMNRNEASDFYYFTDEYFDQLADLMGEQLVLFEARYDARVVAAALCLVGDGRIHIHLSGTDSEYLHLSPAYSIRNAIAEWGIRNGMNIIHHGGGRTNDPDDSLYLYKRQFGSGSADFYVGTHIWNSAAYDAICQRVGVSPAAEGFFPAYRRRG